jgi:hypothetical protein
VSFRLRGPMALTVVLLVCWAVAAATLLMLPVVWRPDKFAVPFSPITPAMGMFATVFLIGEVGALSVPPGAQKLLCVHKVCQEALFLHALQHTPYMMQLAQPLHRARAGSLGWQAFARFGGWLVVSAAVYVLYSMHRAEAKEIRDAHT